MERVRALVNKLQEQLDQQADASALLVTLQLLQTELLAVQSIPSNRTGSAKVAVVLPNPSHLPERNVQEPVPHQEAPEPEPTQHIPAQEPQQDWLHTLMQEIPTLAHQKEIRELNEVISQQQSASLNERLKVNTVEVAEVINREPINDLRKAIGINDRFVFVNELFRGDEVMYERSIKTINSFNVLQEAEFWMQRELILKLGWDDTKESVRHFRQLVRRRFASM
ncbi:hypothetical protein KJS94_08215 [Flavihumibacter rivuli]|uniref:hypothetical protein n=1 Tax=Flavihumibacter rivuli TaxID=2838156 RepID=UPI001BDE7536|nr:hypothetical protein [Flavihumibacter rivuli]ULQ58178.1 hypothetical protein KJS94_08215 [Flavihumibacter rivuli]